jgi:hypothetical protein
MQGATPPQTRILALCGAEYAVPQESAEPMPEKIDAHQHSAPAVEDQQSPSGKVLPPAAQRALAEAEARRAAIDAHAAEVRRVREVNGRGGLDPVRYDDWEVKGIASDF